MIVALKRLINEFVVSNPQITNGKIRYYFCGSIPALLMSEKCKIKYLGLKGFDGATCKKEIKDKLFDVKRTKIKDFDIISLGKRHYDFVSANFVPKGIWWKNFCDTRNITYTGRTINSIWIDDLMEWRTINDIVQLMVPGLKQPIFTVSPEALIVFKMYEMPFKKSHLKEAISLCKSLSKLDKRRMMFIMKKNMIGYLSMIEFQSAMRQVFDNSDMESTLRKKIKTPMFQKQLCKHVPFKSIQSTIKTTNFYKQFDQEIGNIF